MSHPTPLLTTRDGSPLVPWTRFWLPEGTDASVDADGFFRDPEPNIRGFRYANASARTLANLEGVRCLVLLGEPGAGKTTELDALRVPGSTYVDLGTVGGERSFDRKLTDAPALTAWRERGEALALVVDAYDEALLRVENAAALLVEALTETLPADADRRRQRAGALRLRIASRGGDWPASATKAFRSLWGTENVQTLHLAPLRRVDVRLAAETAGVDPGDFLAAVVEHGVGPWATQPLTLFWLLKLYARDRSFPSTRAGLFEEGARLLCHEHNSKRRETRQLGRLDPEDRLRVAARLAALMRFGERATLVLAPPGLATEGALLAREAKGLERDAAGQPLTVGEAELADVVRHTGLFRSAGRDAFRWTQESIADFLAAWYLRHRGASPGQALNLIAATSDGRVAPQLRVVAGWTASLVEGVHERVSATDPHVVLAGDPQALSDARREQATHDLLAAFDDERLDDFRDGVGPLRGLRHATLRDQLLDWIDAPARSPWARREAVWIAVQSRLHDLAPGLIERALDPSLPLQVRTAMVYGASHLDRPESLSELRTLALDSAESEEAASLRKAARSVLWPRDLSFRDLAASVSLDPRDENDITDDVFFKRALSEGDVTDDQLVDALEWVHEGGGEAAPNLAGPVVLAAATRLDVPALAGRLALLLVDLALRDVRLGRYLDDADLRRALSEAADRAPFLGLLLRATRKETDRSAAALVQVRFAPFRSADVPWVIERLARAEADGDDATADACQSLLNHLSTPGDVETRETVQAAIEAAEETSERVAYVVRWNYRAWDLGDPEVQRIREQWLRPKREGPDPPDPPIQDQIQAALTEHGKDVATAWRHVCYLLTLDPKNGKMRFRNGDWAHDITALGAWDTLDEPLRARLTRLAEAYLGAVRPGEGDWTAYEKPQTFTYRVVDGVKAFWLLADRDPDALDRLSTFAWSAWAPALLLSPRGGSGNALGRSRDLLRRAYDADPDRVVADFARALQIGRCSSTLLGAMEGLQDPRLSDTLADAVRGGLLSDAALAEAADHLAESGHPDVLDWMAERARTDSPDDAIPWAIRLVRLQPARAWTEIGARFGQDDAFARTLLTRIASRWGGRGAPAETPVSALVALERRLHSLFPPEDDPPVPKGVYSPSPEDDIRSLRHSFSSQLVSQATPESLAAIESLRDVLGAETTDFQVGAAQRLRRERSHRPVEPDDLLALLLDTRARLSRSARDLYEIVVESLGDFEEWLHAEEAPRVEDLWNRVTRREALRMAEALARTDSKAAARLPDDVAVFRSSRRANPTLTAPKDERALSDLALRFLRERLGPHGVLVAQEAQVKRGHATDLLVSHAMPDGQTATVVVEVKASWNRHLYDALADQLAQGYLNGVTRQHGVYLVGWFGSAGWFDPGTGDLHPKARTARRGGIERLRAALAAKAASASEPHRHVTSVVVDASLPSPRASA